MRQENSDVVSDCPAEPEPPPTPSNLHDYAAKMIKHQLDKMLAQVEGVRSGEDIEPVHQMRVWSRRSRAALEVFRCCFPRKEYAELEREVKAVTDALSEARDLDVMTDTLRKRAERLPAGQKRGVESFIARLQQECQTSQKPVLKALRRLDRHDPVRLFRHLAEASQQKESAHG